MPLDCSTNKNQYLESNNYHLQSGVQNFFHASEQSPSLTLGSTSERTTFVPSGRNFIGMGSERRLTIFPFNIPQIKLLSTIFSEEDLELHQRYLG